MSDQSPRPRPVGLFGALARYGWIAVLLAVFGVLLGNVYSDRQDELYGTNGQVRLAAGPALDPIAGDRESSDRYFVAQLDLLGARSTREKVEQDAALAGADASFTTDARSRGDDTATIRAEAKTAQSAVDTFNTAVGAYRTLRREQVAAEAQSVVAALERQSTQFRASLDAVATAILKREGEFAAVQPPTATPVDRTNAILAARITDPALIDLQNSRDGLLRSLQTNATRVADIGLAAETYEPIAVLQTPKLPTNPVTPARARNAIFGAALLFLLGCALAWRASELRSELAERNAVLAGGAPVVASISMHDLSHVGQIPFGTAGQAAFADAALGLARGDKLRPLAVSVHSASASTPAAVALNLAVALHMKWPETALVDCEFEARPLSNALQLPNDLGITDLFLPQVTFDDCVRKVDPGEGHSIEFVPAGRRWTAERGDEFYLSDGIDRAVAELKKSYEFVVLSGTSLATAGSSTAVAAAVDGVILVVEPGDREGLDNALERLRRAGTPVLAMIAGTPLKDTGLKSYLYPVWRALRLRGA
ncbi:MAG: hypothetical protein ABIQ73_24505 [Acidimicrobiales bacterium]